MIRPGKTRSKHRLYRRRDVETLLEIKRLLHTERFTIEGAKRRLKVPASVATPAKREQMKLPLGERTYRDALVRLKKDVEELYKLLS
jgi:DNA-binding transcriptional MerR regulator